jgi:hypothetical protein
MNADAGIIVLLDGGEARNHDRFLYDVYYRPAGLSIAPPQPGRLSRSMKNNLTHCTDPPYIGFTLGDGEKPP